MSQHVEETVVFPKGADIKHHQTPPLWYTTMALGSIAYTFLVKRSILSMNRGSVPAGFDHQVFFGIEATIPIQRTKPLTHQ